MVLSRFAASLRHASRHFTLGITEARQAGAPTDDVAKTAGHSSKRTTARVYDCDTLEAARRIAKARMAHRGRNEA
jgi:integrase